MFHKYMWVHMELRVLLGSPPWSRGWGERWTCNPRVSGSILGAGNLKKLLIWMKIHGLQQNHNKDARVR